MTKKLLISSIGFALILGAAFWIKINAAPAPAHQQVRDGKTYHVIFEMTEPEPEKWSGVFNNVNHLIAALGSADVEVEVVVHGPAIPAVTKDDGAQFSSKFGDLRKKGVLLAACHNSLEGRHIPLSNVQSSFTVVPSGVAEVVKKQHDGWQYLKAAW